MNRKVGLLVVLLGISFQALAGGGWTKAKGEGFFLLSQRYIGGTFYSTNMPAVITTPLSGVLSTNFYGEYGLTDRLELSYYSPLLTGAFVQAGTDENGRIFTADNALGLGDMDIALKYGLLKGKLSVAASLGLGLPTGNNQAGETQQLMLGDGEFNQILKIEASGSLNSDWFMSGLVGFNHRTQGFSEELHVGLDLGRTHGNWIFMLKTYLLKSLNNGDAAVASLPGVYSNNLEYMAVSPVVMRKFKNSGLIVDLGFAPYLRNIIAAPSLTVGYYWEIGK